MAWIEPRKGTRGTVYYVRWRENNRTVSTRRHTLVEARVLKATIEAKMAKGSYVEQAARETPFGVFAQQVLEADYALGEETRKNYETCLRRQLSPIALLPISRIDAQVVRRLFQGLSGASEHTRHQARKTISKVCSAAVEEGILSRNPARAVKLGKAPRRSVQPLSPERIQEVSEAVPRRYRAAVLLGAWGGLRIGEVGALEWEDFNFSDYSLRITKSITASGRVKEPKTKAGIRTVHLPGWVGRVLMEHRMEFPTWGPIFLTDEGRRVTSQTISRVMRETGVRFHDLRHTQAALLIRMGAHPKEIQERMGHSSIQVTFDVYGHLFPERPQELASKLEEFEPKEMGRVIEL